MTALQEKEYLVTTDSNARYQVKFSDSKWLITKDSKRGIIISIGNISASKITDLTKHIGQTIIFFDGKNNCSSNKIKTVSIIQ